MANREELGIIRAARAGQSASQLALGKLYLFGSAGLPNSLPTALHWLDRAAQQGSAEACELIGAHIPLELARRSERPLARWYERAYDGGVRHAGLVLAQLVLGQRAGGAPDPACRAKAMRALAEAALAGQADAQWLLSQQPGAAPPVAGPAAGPSETPAAAPADASPGATAGRGSPGGADSGTPQARFALLEAAWQDRQWEAYLQRALPLARALVQAADAPSGARLPSAPDEVTLLSRCARVLTDGALAHQAGQQEIQRFWELAAAGHDRYGQMAVGLWFARMRADGTRTAQGAGSANFKKAIRWLTLAGEQGLAEAWYAISRIYIKPEFSRRNVVDAQRYLERAAEMGYRDAQLECGNSAWRARREHPANDVRALYWLQQAAAGGCPQAAAALRRIVPEGTETCAEAGTAAAAALALTHPLLAARLELAAVFKLSRAEALLLDLKQADQGHCLVIDIRASYGRSKRRLVLLETAQQRHTLDRIARLFEHVDCGPGGPEGNYRQRLYRLKTVLRDAPEQAGGELAAGTATR